MPKLVIPTYLQAQGLPESEARKKWEEIRDAIHQIYAQNASNLSFQVLYNCGYQIARHKHGDILYNGVEETLKKFIQGLRETIMQKNDGEFLQGLLSQWEKHRRAVSMVRDILMYLDRTYVVRRQKTPVFDLGIQLFGKEVFHKNTLERIQRLMMESIERDRNGETVADRFLLKNLTTMMLEIGKEEIYKPHFEKEFLRRSEIYFVTEANQYFSSSTATDYLHKVKQRLTSERDRAIRCLDSGTRPKIESIIKKKMIDAYKNLIIEKEGSGCKVMLRDWRLADLKLVYEVLSLVPGALDPCVKLVHEFCEENGLSIINDEQMDEKPLDMIQKCIDLRVKHDELLSQSFSKRRHGRLVRNEKFSKAVRTAWQTIVNKHQQFPEYLSLFVDSKLKKGKHSLPDSEYDSVFEEVLALFRPLVEKDIFEKYYKVHLAKRLLGAKSHSDEAEKLFISKLKALYGYSFTSKLEGMFGDMKISSELQINYNMYLSEKKIKPTIDVNVKALTLVHWPLTRVRPVNVPKELEEQGKIYKDFYINSHSGRELTYQYQMGSAFVRANGFAKPYELDVTTYQMMILLLFNDNKTLTYGQIEKMTNIPSGELKKNLVALSVKSKLHDRVLSRGKGSKTLSADMEFTPNDSFKSKLIKVKIMPVVLKQSKKEAKETYDMVQEERKWLLDACIVRIMKSRRKMTHLDLSMEVTKQLSGRFLPSPADFKKRIESLLQRDYLERDPDFKGYIYVS